MLKRWLLWMINSYQYCLSPLLGNCCRFYPSCADYAKQAITRHGILIGSSLIITRLVKCQPLHPGGVDVVPDLKAKP